MEETESYEIRALDGRFVTDAHLTREEASTLKAVLSVTGTGWHLLDCDRCTRPLAHRGQCA